MTPPPYEIVARFGLTKRVGVSRVKRLAIRRCRMMVKRLGAGASGNVKQSGVGVIYRCSAWDVVGTVTLREDTL